MRSPPTPCWRKWEPTGRSFATSMPSLPGPASVPTIRRAEETFFPPKPAGVPIASIAPCGYQPRPWKRAPPILGIFYRKRCARLGRPAGIPATAHKLARIFFHMVTTGQAYDQSIFAAEEQRQHKHLESSLRRKAAKLGYQLIPLPQTA